MVGNQNAHHEHKEKRHQPIKNPDLRPPLPKDIWKSIRSSLIVMAYDITDDRRRYRVVKALKQYGTAINMSVYECMLTDSQFEKLRTRLEKLIDSGCDKIVYYPICLDCFSKIIYQPEKIRRNANITAVIWGKTLAKMHHHPYIIDYQALYLNRIFTITYLLIRKT